MAISAGERLPDADFLVVGDAGLQKISLESLFGDRRIVLFGLPGAFTPTCDKRHLPGFIALTGDFARAGIDEIACVSVNDPQVMRAWGEVSGARGAGIRMLADAGSHFTRAIGMDFDAPEAGYYGRSRRYSMLVEDRVVVILNAEKTGGTCELSSAAHLLAQTRVTGPS